MQRRDAKGSGRSRSLRRRRGDSRRISPGLLPSLSSSCRGWLDGGGARRRSSERVKFAVPVPAERPAARRDARQVPRSGPLPAAGGRAGRGEEPCAGLCWESPFLYLVEKEAGSQARALLSCFPPPTTHNCIWFWLQLR